MCMKKSYLFLAAAALVLASCSSEEVVNGPNAPTLEAASTTAAINFSPLSKGATRSQVFQSTADLSTFTVRCTWSATVNTGDSIWIGGVKVILGTTQGYGASAVAGTPYSAFGTTGMQDVILGSKGWTFKDGVTRYWPYKAKIENDKVTGYTCYDMDFLAYTPTALNEQYASLKDSVAEQKKYWEYVPATPTPISQMQDVCIASTEGANSSTGAVALDFYHIFSQIVFKAKKTAKYEVDIRDIEIGGIRYQGKFQLNNLQSPTPWYEATGSTTSYSGKGSNTVSLTAAADTTNMQITEEGSELLLVPQEIAKWEHNGNAATSGKGYIKVTFRYRESGAGTAWITGEGSADGYETTYFPLQAKWGKGKKYCYTLLFGGAVDDDKKGTDTENPDPGTGDDNPGGYDENGNPKAPSVAITFSPTVVDWTPQQVDVKF